MWETIIHYFGYVVFFAILIGIGWFSMRRDKFEDEFHEHSPQNKDDPYQW